MVSNVVITRRAQDQLDSYVLYLLMEKSSQQAAKALVADARKTKEALLNIEGSLGRCADEELKALGYQKIHFRNHAYFFIYRIIETLLTLKLFIMSFKTMKTFSKQKFYDQMNCLFYIDIY